MSICKPKGRVSVADFILIALRQIEMRHIFDPVDLSALVVECWNMDRWLFGLKGFENQHPSDNVVIARLVDLCKEGLTVRGPARHYRLSDGGRARAARLISAAA